MKKFFALLFTAIMIMAIAIPSFAADDGTITINGVSENSVYEIYKLLDLESYNPETGAYSYKVNAEWDEFFATEEALTYVAIDEAGYVTWIAAEDDDTVAAFAKLALAFAKENGIVPVKSSTVDGDMAISTNDQDKLTGTFSGLSLGYYLVDSNVGALCGLTTTNPTASINAKNGVPTVDKQVQEDSTEQWGTNNSADIGQTVNFRVTINVHAGAENYVLHDKMSDGLTFDANSVAATYNGEAVSAEDFSVVVPGTCDNEDGCTFEVVFTKAFCDKLETNDKLIVYYSAMLNRNAVVNGDGNPNEAWLEYGEDHFTTKDTTNTKTYGFDIVKTDSQNKLLDGAQFRIYDAANGGNEIGVVLMDDGVTYRRARADEQADGLNVPIVVKDGQIRVVGFDNGVYFLEEIVAPEGYNKLTARQKFTIADGNLDAVFNDGIFSTGSGVHVVNKTGSMLPETGGTGTVIAIVVGLTAVLATGVVLVTRKRVSKLEG